MDYKINDKIIAEDIDDIPDQPYIFGDNNVNGHVVIKTSKNEQLLYLDGACDGPAPLFIALTKSRGTQEHKEPVCADDMLGGLQVYSRIASGNSIGYNQKETPLAGALQFKVGPSYNGGEIVPTEFLLGLSDTTGMSIKLKVDSSGNLSISGDIESGELRITDEPAYPLTKDPDCYVKVFYHGQEYAMPLYRC
jgi:hypothetical protein